MNQSMEERKQKERRGQSRGQKQATWGSAQAKAQKEERSGRKERDSAERNLTAQRKRRTREAAKTNQTSLCILSSLFSPLFSSSLFRHLHFPITHIRKAFGATARDFTVVSHDYRVPCGVVYATHDVEP